VKPAQFDHQAIHVRDLAKSAAFYETVLGLERIADPFQDQQHVWLCIGGQTQLHLIAGATTASEQDIHVHICFRVASVDDFLLRLKESRVSYANSKGEREKVTVRPDGVKQVYIQDPDGYWIEVNDNRP